MKASYHLFAIKVFASLVDLSLWPECCSLHHSRFEFLLDDSSFTEVTSTIVPQPRYQDRLTRRRPNNPAMIQFVSSMCIDSLGPDDVKETTGIGLVVSFVLKKGASA